jgi:hypothetical protein
MKLLLIAFCLLSSFAMAAAQSPARVLKQAEQAIGGGKAVRSVTSWEKRGTVTRVSDGASGSFALQTAAPNLYNYSFDVGGFETETGYNGKSGWTRDSRDGLRTLTGDSGIGISAEAVFRNSLWLDAKRDKVKIVGGGASQLEGRPVNIVVLITPKGANFKLFFDAASKLLVREEVRSGEFVRSFDYSDYRPAGSVRVPHRIKMTVAEDTFDVVLDQVQAGARIAKSEFDFPNLANEPLPDIPTLLKELQANEDKVETILDTYSYVQRSTRRELGKDGVLRDKESETYQLSFYKGNRLRRLIEKNGKPLNAEQQADEDKEVGKRVEEIEKQIAKAEAKGGPPSSEDSRRISVAEVLRASKLSNPRRERFRGRDVIVFDFEPNPAFDYKNAKSMLKFFGKTAGAMWIDEKDKQVARLEAFLADSFNIGGGVLAKLKKGASFTLEQERVNDEIWLPSVADINLSVRVLLVKGIDLNQVIRSYDYRKFATEVKDAKVNSLN